MFYKLYLKLRHLCYDKGWKKSYKAAVPTICIGNLTVGGTGKTPHTERLLQLLLHSDEWAYHNLGLLSRGYKRKSRGYQLLPPDASARLYGDEPVQMARKLPAVTVAVDKDRVEGCRRLVEEAGAELIVLDDAFQYRRLQASCSVVLIDFNRPIFKDSLLPWGRLRDLPSRLAKADIVVVTKCPASLDDWTRQQWRKMLKLGPEKPLFFTTLSYKEPEGVFEEADKRYLYAKRLVLLSGIANDAPLRGYLSDTYQLVEHLHYRDHHRFRRRDIRALSAAIKANPTACIMTTEKDAQRLRDVKKLPESLKQRLFYMPVAAAFDAREQEEAFLQAVLSRI